MTLPHHPVRVLSDSVVLTWYRSLSPIVVCYVGLSDGERVWQTPVKRSPLPNIDLQLQVSMTFLPASDAELTPDTHCAKSSAKSCRMHGQTDNQLSFHIPVLFFFSFNDVTHGGYCYYIRCCLVITGLWEVYRKSSGRIRSLSFRDHVLLSTLVVSLKRTKKRKNNVEDKHQIYRLCHHSCHHFSGVKVGVKLVCVAEGREWDVG